MLSLAIGADGTHVEGGFNQLETNPFGSFGACCQDGFAFEFLGPAASDAHHMVMITVVITGQLKAAPPFAELEFLQESHISQESQGAIHRGERHFQILLCQLLVHVLGAEMVAATKPFEQFQDPFALGGEPPTVLMQTLLQRAVLTNRQRRKCHRVLGVRSQQ